MTTGPSTSTVRRLGSAIAGLAGLVVLVVVAGVALGGGRSAPSPSPQVPASPSAPGVGAVGPTPSAVDSVGTATPMPSPTPSPTARPTPEPTPAPTPEPTDPPTPEPTREPTRAPTPEPTTKPTKAPTPDPKPEGTPRITRASGSFGETLTVEGIKVRVQRTDPRVDALRCVTDDPDRQGWTEQISFELRMTWPDAGDAEEPWVAVGKKPWNVLQFDGPSPFTSGADYIVTTCHRPGDTDKVLVEISPPGSPLIYLRWSFS